MRPAALLLVATLAVVPASAAAQGGQIRTPGEIPQPKGTWQTPGEIKVPTGPWRTPGEIQTPGRIQAIKEQCVQRFRIGADTLFEFDRATLTGDAEKKLAELGPMLRDVGAHPVTIEGHTDALGTPDYNRRLSEERARSVKAWLAARGYVPDTATIRGYGKDRPVAPNTKPDGTDDPAGRQLNRRVDVVLDTCR